MRGRGRMAGQRLAVTDVDQPSEQLERILKTRPGFAAALEPEAQDARGASLHQALGDVVIGMVHQPGVAHPGHPRMLLQVRGDVQRVGADAVHAQRQGFDALQNEKGVERGQRRAHIAQGHHAGAGDERGSSELRCVAHTVIAHVGLDQQLEAVGVRGPVELAGVDDGSAHAVAVAAEVFGQRVHHDVGAVLERTAEVGRGHGVVHDQRHAMGVRHRGERADIGHIAQRIADGFAKHRAGAGVDQLGKGIGVARVGEAHLQPLPRKGVGEQVVGAAIQTAAGDDVVARLGQGLNRRGDGSHARSHRQRRHAAFERCDALFQHVVGRIHHTGVDIARDLQIE